MPTTADKIEIVEAHGRRFKVYDGTYYDVETADEVVYKLDSLCKSRTRVRSSYGYTSQKQIDQFGSDKTVGENWLEENVVTGLIGRSMGPIKIPLIINNSRNMGGPGILTENIVRMMTTDGGLIWQHPQYHQPKMTSHNIDEGEYKAELRVNGNVHARFKSVDALRHYLRKLRVVAPLEN